MLFLLFVMYLSSFVGTLKNEIPRVALELWQLKIELFSPGILKFNTKHEENLLILNCAKVPALFYLYFMQAWVDWVLTTFGTQVIKKNGTVWPVFPDYLFVSCDNDFEYCQYHFVRVKKSCEYWYCMIKI